MKKRYYVLFLMCLLCHLVVSAAPPDSLSRLYLFKKAHLKFQLNTFTSSGEVTLFYGDVQLSTQRGGGVSAVITQQHHLSNSWSFLYGLEYGGIPMNIKRFFSTSSFSSLDEDVLVFSKMLNPYLAIPINVLYRTPLTKKTFLHFQGGTCFRYITDSSLSGTFAISFNRTGTNTVTRAFNHQYDNQFRLNYNFGIGVSVLTKRYDFIDIQVITHISPRVYLAQNEQHFLDLPEETSDQYRSNGSYIGVSVGYTFTKVHKQMKKSSNNY